MTDEAKKKKHDLKTRRVATFTERMQIHAILKDELVCTDRFDPHGSISRYFWRYKRVAQDDHRVSHRIHDAFGPWVTAAIRKECFGNLEHSGGSTKKELLARIHELEDENKQLKVRLDSAGT